MYIPTLVLIASFIVFVFGPSSLEQLTFVPVHNTITIKTNKNLPPYIAYESSQREDQFKTQSEWNQLTKVPMQTLSVSAQTQNESRDGIRQIAEERPYKQKIVLNEVIIQKQIEPVMVQQFSDNESQYDPASSPIVREQTDWKMELTKAQKARIDHAETNGAIATFFKENETKNNINSRKEDRPNHKETVTRTTKPAEAASDASRASGNGETIKERVIADNTPQFDTKALGRETQIIGHIEIHKGLAITNEHHIEFRRKEEGVFQERGEVDIQKGTYAITTFEPRGSLVAQLVTKEGNIIGEGSVRIATNINETTKTVEGPKVRIFPKSETSGLIKSAYKSESAEPAPEMTKAMILGGVADLEIKKDGKLQYDLLARGSSTLMRAEAPGFGSTQQIILSGEDFESTLFPESMLKSLKSIISEQRMSNFNDPEMPVIWGQVLQDGKPVAGVEISLENIEEADVVYFNELHLPDVNLKVTSTQGGFVILNPPTGFQSLLAKRGEAYYAHQNTVVDQGVVSFVKVETSLKTESVSLKVYDAFTGRALDSDINLQGAQQKIHVENGYHLELLPLVSRMSLLEAMPAAGYLNAEYLYNESLGYIHVPLISEQWVNWILSQQKINQSPARSIIIGFVPEEDFEVGILNSEDVPQQNVLFFNSQGEIIKSKAGAAGGGFIIFNAPVGVLEVATQLTKTQKTMSKLIPAEPGKVFVLNYRSE